MGGLGKTTLAQLAYNDRTVEGHFNLRMWACVSEDFDVQRITKLITESATGRSYEPLALDPLQNQLRNVVHGKRFFLTLDDVWSEDSELWDKLQSPFQVGAMGSQILITTRSEKVASAMGSTHVHKLRGLSDDECWLLFSRRAFLRRTENECSKLEDVGRQIVDKCEGLPLAAKTIGSAMGSRRTRREWELVLGSEIWNSQEILGGILPALLLSYYDLPLALKQCFAYCSLFPKDWWLRKDQLVELWMAQGFIQSNESRDMEAIGGLYFDDLLRRSLFQDEKRARDGTILRCKMHDLVHDLAQSVAGGDCSAVDIEKQSSLNLRKLRHVLLYTNEFRARMPSFLTTLSEAQKLRTLLLDDFALDGGYPPKIFHYLRCLRAFALDSSELPRGLGQLKHLRYLRLEDMRELPKEVSNCVNLQTLILCYFVHLSKLPKGIGKLIRLRRLEFYFMRNWEEWELTNNAFPSLLELTIYDCPKLKAVRFDMRNWEEWELTNNAFPSLLKLTIYDCPKLKAVRFDLLPILRKLTLRGDNDGLFSAGPLPDHPKLQHLEISLTGERRSLPDGWLRQLKALQTLVISDCPELSHLPDELQSFTGLQELVIDRCPLLQGRCKEGGEEWGKISHIPRVRIYE